MNDEWTGQARFWIIGGYAVGLLGSLVYFFGQFSTITHTGISTTFAIEVVVGPLVSVGSLWAWWWLSKLKLIDNEHRRIVRNGVVGLIFMLICQATISFTSFTSMISIRSIEKWVLIANFLWTVGNIGALVGFLAAFVTLRAPSAPSEDWET
jgi:hypothetical protein